MNGSCLPFHLGDCNGRLTAWVPESRDQSCFKSLAALCEHCLCACSVASMSDSVTPWTVARQAPLTMGFSRQEFWGGLPFPPPGDLPDPGIEPASPMFPALQAGSSPLSQRESPCVG